MTQAKSLTGFREGLVMHMNNKKIFLIYILRIIKLLLDSYPGSFNMGHPSLCKTWIIPHIMRSNEDTTFKVILVALEALDWLLITQSPVIEHLSSAPVQKHKPLRCISCELLTSDQAACHSIEVTPLAQICPRKLCPGSQETAYRIMSIEG